MSPQTVLPWVSAVLQARWVESRRTYIEAHPNLPNWPRRRSRKHRPIPGLYEAAEAEG